MKPFIKGFSEVASASYLVTLLLFATNFEACDWSMRFMQVILLSSRWSEYVCSPNRFYSTSVLLQQYNCCNNTTVATVQLGQAMCVHHKSQRKGCSSLKFSQISEKKVSLFFNCKGTLLSAIFIQSNMSKLRNHALGSNQLYSGV
jgi:hypothetical protein